MSQTFLPPKWLEQLCDPYAVLGISVNANDRQILNYHTLAKLLHLDRYTKSCNLAYEQVKHQHKRLIAIAMLRSQARVLQQQASFSQGTSN